MPWFVTDDKPLSRVRTMTQSTRSSEIGRVIISSDIREEANAAYKATLHILEHPKPEMEKMQNHNQIEEDYYRNVTTCVLLAWTFTNWALATIVM